jgi:hypothetical protein
MDRLDGRPMLIRSSHCGVNETAKPVLQSPPRPEARIPEPELAAGRRFFCAHCAVTERDDRLFLSPAGTALKVDPAACDRPPAAQDEDRVCSIESVVDFAEPPRSKLMSVELANALTSSACSRLRLRASATAASAVTWLMKTLLIGIVSPGCAGTQSEGWILTLHPTVSWPVYLVSLCGWAGKKLRPRRRISLL